MSDCRNGLGLPHHVPVEVEVFAPDGTGPWGLMCRACASAVVAEYAARLGEVWTIKEVSEP